MSEMYKDTQTWNPYKGCRFDCTYCKPSFKRQAKRQKHNCIDCYNYKPHFHPERLKQYLPKNKLIFCCGNGDIYFAKQEWLEQIFDEMKKRENHTFLVQTKNPICLQLIDIPENVIVGTTIETNRDTIKISKAPSTRVRINELLRLNCRKFITHEPLMEFDLKTLLAWDMEVKPEIVWVGYANHMTNLTFTEPSLTKTNKLIDGLKKFTEVRLKTMREKI